MSELKHGYTTTHRTHYTMDSLASAHERNIYVTRQWFNRSDGHSYVIMAYQQNGRPSARQPYWGIYRVEEWPGYSYAEGNYTLLKGDLTRKEALAQIADVVSSDSGHVHNYWIDKNSIEFYKKGISMCLTGHCKSCSHWIFTEQVERLLEAGQIEILSLTNPPNISQ